MVDPRVVANTLAGKGGGGFQGGRKPRGRPRKNPPKDDFLDLIGDDPAPPGQLKLKKMPSEVAQYASDAVTVAGAALHPSDIPVSNIADPATLYALSRARKEAAQAASAELAFRRKSGLFIPRDVVRTASAEVLATIAQSLRSIPDVIERKMGCDPAITDQITLIIDDLMGELAKDLERIHTQATRDELDVEKE